MKISIIVEQYLEGVGGLQCPICNKWDDKNRFVHAICGDCNEEVEEVLAEAETYDKYDDPFYITDW